MKEDRKEVQILDELLNELRFVKRVIQSCKTGQQLEIAINWMNRWKHSRKKWIESKKMQYLLKEFESIEFFEEINNLQ
jgi:Ser-tRNA(Ala) deacylase AlaX